jgi:6-phosphofructokinase 1
MVVEVMGRHAGWIATMAGIAGGADEILIPEVPFDIDEVCKSLKERYARGKKFSIVAVAEGAHPKVEDIKTNDNEETLTQNMGDKVLVTQTAERDAFGHVRLGGIGNFLAREIEKRMNVETRVTVLGHVQRGGTPTAHDRILATRFGVAEYVLQKHNLDTIELKWGQGAKCIGGEIRIASLDRALELKKRGT